MISVRLFDSGYLIHFSASGCSEQDASFKKIVGTGSRRGGFYVLEDLHIPNGITLSLDLSSFRLSPKSSSFYVWHSCLGHVSSSHLKILNSTCNLGNLGCSHDIYDCSGCKLAKLTALPFNRSSTIYTTPFDLVHSDVWGCAPIATKGGSRYCVSFIDNYSRYCWVYLMKKHFIAFCAMVHTQYSSDINYSEYDFGGGGGM